MKAIIMAGGEGTRLRPLTCDCPKPMMRLMDRPIMDLAVELLALHGVKEAAVTLGYLPERIRDHFGDEAHGVSLRYYTEYHPLGTAGGVKQAKDFLTETFCVLSGDGVTDCDLSAALKYHRNKGAKATMVLKHTADPTPYGLVMTDESGRITRFTEKPCWGEVVSDAVNTGIYILEPEILDMIPDGMYDFGKELFPRLAEKGLLYGWITDGYWCDVGDIPAYLSMTRDALDGKINLPSLTKSSGCIAPDAVIAEGAVVEQPCFIGSGAVVGRGATIGAYSVIGAGVHIGEGASVKRSMLWQGIRLHDGAQARGCVLGKNVTLAPCARVYENCAVGTGAKLGADSEVAPGVCIWPGKAVPEAALAERNIVWGGNGGACFRDGQLHVSDPAEALCCAKACAAALEPREVLLGRSPSATAAAVWHSCAAGLMAQGVSVLDAGVCTEPQLRYAMELMHTDCALMVSGGSITPLHKNGARISSSQQRRICALMSRQDYPRSFMTEPRPVTTSGRSDKAYVAMLASAFTADASLTMPVAVHSENQLLLSLAEQAFERAGISARFEWEDELMELFPGEMGIWLSSDGLSAEFSHAAGMLTAPQNELLPAWTALERGEKILVTGDRATRAISELAQRRGAQIIRGGSTRAAFENTLAGYPLQLRLYSDGIYLALSALSALTENALTLTGWLSTMPRVHRVEKRIPLANDLRGQTLRRFSEVHNGELNMEQNGSFAWIYPEENMPECRVVAEAYNMEAARELCDFCISELKKSSEK